MGDPHGNPQTSPQHADPHEFLVWFSVKKAKVHVDWRVVGWSAGRHVGCRFRHGLLEKSLNILHGTNSLAGPPERERCEVIISRSAAQGCHQEE